MGWSLNQVQPSGTSGAQGVAGVDGATVLIDNSGANDPATNGFILDTQPFKRIIIKFTSKQKF